MLIKFTNKSIHEATGDSLPQIKRWSVAFLEPDPMAGQHSGRKRKYSFAQALKIITGGELVTYYKYTLAAAAQIITDIDSWLEGQGWPLDQFISFHRSGNKTHSELNGAWKWKKLIFYIRRADGDFQYRVREILDQTEKPGGVVQESYRLHYFGNHEEEQDATPYKTIPLMPILEDFARRYCNYLNSQL